MGRTQILGQVVKIERIISATPVSKFRVYMHAIIAMSTSMKNWDTQNVYM